jgi:hypothetical protein
LAVSFTPCVKSRGDIGNLACVTMECGTMRQETCGVLSRHSFPGWEPQNLAGSNVPPRFGGFFAHTHTYTERTPHLYLSHRQKPIRGDRLPQTAPQRGLECIGSSVGEHVSCILPDYTILPQKRGIYSIVVLT